MGEVKNKPDGFVAYDPEMGLLMDMAGESEDAVQRKVDESYYTLNYGWRIRPVKLVYLDEEK